MLSKYLNFTKTTTGLIIFAIVSVVAGLSLLLNPEGTSTLVIRGVGLIWILEGISFALDVWLKKTEEKSDKEE